ncbi:MAG: DUF4920 domain-containing protein [Bacteroidia bacterium]|nr:DUF4920 domain-containing protein [Bacteroidia bacterium]
MKQIVISLMIIAALCWACQPVTGTAVAATPASPEEGAGQTVPPDSLSPDGSRSYHGARITEQGALQLGQLTGLLSTHQGVLPAVKLEGNVEACCQAKGCWMTMKVGDEDMRVKFKDYAFFVPKNSAGKTAIIEGRAFYDTTSVEELRHYAEDAGMTAEEAAKKYTEPKIAVAFEATGVIIRTSTEK